MKKIYALLLLLLILAINCNAQKKESKCGDAKILFKENERPRRKELRPSRRALWFNPNVYRTFVNLNVMRIADKYGAPYSIVDTFQLITRPKIGSDYEIVNDDENGYTIIRVLPIALLRDSITKVGKIHKIVFKDTCQTTVDSTNAYNYVFAIKTDDFIPFSRTLLSTKIMATPLIHPFKLRPAIANSEMKLTTDFTIGYSFGLRLRLGKNLLKRNYVSIIPLGIGLGDSKYVFRKNDGSFSDEQDAVSLTFYSCGILFTFDKINVGLFNGYDAMFGKQNNWIYQNKPWFSFGLGYKFGDN